MNFGETYARAYDAFYRTKDYPAEARFVADRLSAVLGRKSLSILDIGCGTGLHDIELAQAGHEVTGIDASPEMLDLAEQRRAHLAPELRDSLHFIGGDARRFDAEKVYDAVVSLFHVMSYMSNETDFEMALETARRHLPRGGAYLFDFWYGPAVLADPPQPRRREINENGKRVTRITTPQWEKERSLVRIEFEVLETDLATGTSARSREEHLMRYFSISELEQNLSKARFEIVEIREWLSDNAPTERSFGVYALARAI